MGLREERGPAFNWQQYHDHYARGISNGYPRCCVDWWATQTAYGRCDLAMTFGVVEHGPNNQYVPCADCRDNPNVMVLPIKEYARVLERRARGQV